MNLLFYFDLLIENPSFNELIINSNKSVLLISELKTELVANHYSDIDILKKDIQKFSYENSIRLDAKSPSCGGEFRYKNCFFRWHTVIAPISKSGPIFAVRMHKFDSYEPEDFGIDKTTLDSFDMSSPMLFAGPTFSGKTTLMMSILKKYFDRQRVFIMDSTEELNAESPYWFKLGEGQTAIGENRKVSLNDAFNESLRLSPDKYVFGELRKEEGISFYKSLLTGHGGSFTSFHCDRIEYVFTRLSSLCGVKETKLIEAFSSSNPYIYILKRPPNRLKSVYRFVNNQWEELLLLTENSSKE